MSRVRNAALAVALAIWAVGAAAADRTPVDRWIEGFGGLRFDDTWQSAAGLVPAEWTDPDCVLERVFYAADPQRRHYLAGVELDWPGLVYRFFDDRLYAVEAEFATGDGAFARLEACLIARYGAPDLTQSWQDAPADTHVFQSRMRVAAWHSPDGNRSIWLVGDRSRGALAAIDNTDADQRAMAIGAQLAPRRWGRGSTIMSERGP